MKKILIVVDTLNGGGAEKVLKDLLGNLDKSKYNIEILLKSKQGAYLKEVSENYKVMSLNKGRKKMSKIVMLKKLKSFYRILKTRLLSSSFISNKIIKDKYDLEIAFLQGWSTSFVANRRNKAKKIAWVHTDLEKREKFNLKKEKKEYSFFNKIIAVSKDSAKSIENLYPEYKNKIKIIFNPVDAKLIRTMSKEYNVEYPENRINLISVGRLKHVKGYDILLKAHKELIEQGIKYNLYILGEGSEKESLTKYIDKHELEDTVTLLGFKKNPYPYILNADGFVLSSRYEGYSLALAEAIVLGKPIVSTRCTGPKELLNNGEYGIMVESNNTHALRDGIKELILSEDKRNYYKEASLTRSKIFKMKDIIEEIEILLDNI